MRRVLASETNLEHIPSVDNFDLFRLCVVDKCANAHIWNTKEDFEAGSLKPINRLSNRWLLLVEVIFILNQLVDYL